MRKEKTKHKLLNAKHSRGITLVALIITIIVLLILAVVSIGAIKNSKIISHSQNAADEWKQAQENEASLLAGYEALLNEQMDIGPWEIQTDGETIKNGKTGETKTIGGTFTNDEVIEATGGTKSTYTGTWTILGVEKGKLKLVTTANAGGNVTLGKNDPKAPAYSDLEEIFDKAGETTSKDVEKAIWSYQHAEETLNNYAKERTGIASAISITIEDIEEILDITEAKKVELNSNYGRTYRYFYDTASSKVKSEYKSAGSDTYTGTNTTSYTSEVFVDKQGNAKVVDSEGDEIELDFNYYQYSNAFTNSNFASSLGTGYYWLASPCVYCSTNYASFYVRYVFSGSISNTYLFRSGGATYSDSFGVRAVVYI